MPHSRITPRNWRSLSVNGRSADVTKSTRSERGTKSAVIASCSRMTALVPGVSTIAIWRRNSTGAVMTCRCADRSTRVAVSPNWSRFTWAVVGVTPSFSTGAPRSALMNALLPALNSPTMTTRKSSSSCWIDRRRASRLSGAASRRTSTSRRASRARRSSLTSSWSSGRRSELTMPAASHGVAGHVDSVLGEAPTVTGLVARLRRC